MTEVKAGREAQSIAFFSTPGMLWLNSGAHSTSPSAASMSASICLTVGGRLSPSKSWL